MNGSPIFTYGGRGTTKPGVDTAEHAIIYSHGQSPQLLPGEQEMSIPPIPVVMNPGERPFDITSRLWFGISFPVQYNIKVKDLGYIPLDRMPTLLGSLYLENHPGANTLTDGSNDISMLDVGTERIDELGQALQTQASSISPSSEFSLHHTLSCINHPRIRRGS